MRKIQIIGLALFAVFAFSALAATSAFAHEWLLDGAVLAAATAVESEGELEISDMKGGVFSEEVSLLCSGLNKGFVGPKELDEVTEVLNLAGNSKDISDCKVEKGTCPDPLVEAENLPWLTELFLNAKGEFRDLIGPGTGGEPAWLVVCLGLFGEEIHDLCEGHTNVLVTNEGNNVDTLFDAESEKEPATCTRGGVNEGLVKGLNLLFSTGHIIAVN